MFSDMDQYLHGNEIPFPYVYLDLKFCREIRHVYTTQNIIYSINFLFRIAVHNVTVPTLPSNISLFNFFYLYWFSSTFISFFTFKKTLVFQIYIYQFNVNDIDNYQNTIRNFLQKNCVLIISYLVPGIKCLYYSTTL